MKTKLIVEIASSHNGDLELAKALIRTAAKNGADIVKFQDWKAKNVSDTDPDKPRYEKYQFPEEWYSILPEYCASHGVEFLTSCFNAERAEVLAGYGLKKIKIASVCLPNRELLMMCGAHFDEIIASTAMQDRETIEEAADILASNTRKFTLMACTAEYPTPPEHAGLKRIDTLKELLEGQHYASVGFSSHAHDLDVPKAAIAKGIEYLEVHFSLSRHLPQIPHVMYEGGSPLTTHYVSLEPHELRELSGWRDKVALMSGDGEFKFSEVETKIRERYLGRYGK